jgi:hypothetical protein
MGIEPTSEAWEASILPLYDARSSHLLARLYIISSAPAFAMCNPPSLKISTPAHT